MVARYSAGLTVSGFVSGNADVNCDNTININDALVIARYTANQATICPGKTITPTPTPTPTVTTITGSEVVLIGDSVIALSHEITNDLNILARNNKVIASSDKFREAAVSGMRLAGGGSPTVPQQYANAKAQSPVKWIIMDGGGNDCLQGSCSSPVTSSCADLANAATAARNLLNQMGTDNIKSVIYFFYYDATGSLQEKLNVLRPMIQNIVTSTTKPKCYFLDLRPVFSGHPEYLISDGIHPSTSGSQAIANAIWDIVQKNNFFSN